MKHRNRWQRRFSASSCLLLATVDLPRDYAGRLSPGQRPAHWEHILAAHGLDGVRLNLTKGWNLNDAAKTITEAHARGMRVMIDIVSRLRIAHIVLKPETAEGLRNLPETLSALDDYTGGAAIEVPRGDLAVELPRHELGLAQEHCFTWGRMRQVPVGVATGLLGSMQHSPEPSRADVGDAWAALRAGAAFLLLADETANDGQHPREAISALRQLRELAHRQATVSWQLEDPLTRQGDNA